jgi:hypothetical protein
LKQKGNINQDLRIFEANGPAESFFWIVAEVQIIPVNKKEPESWTHKNGRQQVEANCAGIRAQAR